VFITDSSPFTSQYLGRLHRNAHLLRPRPDPGHPAPDLTITSLNSHVICTGPQLLIEGPFEADKSIQAVVEHVEEKRSTDGVCVLRRFVTGSGLSASVDLLSDAGEGPLSSRSGECVFCSCYPLGMEGAN